MSTLIMIQQLGAGAAEVRRIFPATVYQAIIAAR
jgi:hypothetical protein